MKIFISYSWTISEWLNILMEKLKEKIKNKGMEIEFIWDKTHLKPGNNMHYFMENSIREADKVFYFVMILILKKLMKGIKVWE